MRSGGGSRFVRNFLKLSRRPSSSSSSSSSPSCLSPATADPLAVLGSLRTHGSEGTGRAAAATGGREACGPGPGCRCAFRAGEFPPHANIILAFCDSWGSERGTRMNFSWYFLPRENGQASKNSSRVNSSAKCQFGSMQPYRKTNLSHVYEIPTSPFLAIQISHQHCTDDVGTESPPPPPPPPSAPAMADRSGKAYSLNRRRSRSPQFVAEGNH